MIHYITTNGIGNPTVGKELPFVERAGIPVVLHSMRRYERPLFRSDEVRRLHESTRVLYPIPPLRLALSVARAAMRFRGRFLAALANGLIGRRESLRQRAAALFHLCVACDWALRLRSEPVSLIHAQWVHSSGTIGMYAAWLLDRPFSFMGHAADLFRDRVALEDKVRRASFIACISTFHRDLFRRLGAREEQLEIVYCGIDPDHFEYRPRVANPGRPLRIVSVGRLVEKKGFADLIRACRVLRERQVAFECTIAGSGPLLAELRELALREGVAAQVTLTGEAVDQDDLPALLHRADVFCLPCVWARDNDVDGLPQVLMEAMACGVAVVSTRLVGIPDLVIHEETGLLVEPHDVAAIADSLVRLRDDPDLCGSLVAAARAHVEAAFSAERALQPLIARFRRHLGGAWDDDHRPSGRAAMAAPEVPEAAPTA